MPSLEAEASFEERIIPTWARAAGLSRCFLYRGRSMAPTFRSGHLLYVRPTTHDIQPGDVVVFAGLSGDDYVTHRVVRVTSVGLITRGDGSWCNDAPVAFDRVVGRVEMLEDQGCPKLVRGGNRGLWGAQIRWKGYWVGGWFRRGLQTPYRVLHRSPLIRQVLGRLFWRQLKVVRLETPAGPLVKTIHWGRTVARWWPTTGHFECHKPYDLIIPRPDES